MIIEHARISRRTPTTLMAVGSIDNPGDTRGTFNNLVPIAVLLAIGWFAWQGLQSDKPW